MMSSVRCPLFQADRLSLTVTDLPNAHAHNQPQVFKIFNSISRLLIDRLDLWKNRLDSIDLIDQSMIFRSTRLGRFSMDSIDSIDPLRGLLCIANRSILPQGQPCAKIYVHRLYTGLALYIGKWGILAQGQPCANIPHLTIHSSSPVQKYTFTSNAV